MMIKYRVSEVAKDLGEANNKTLSIFFRNTPEKQKNP